MAIRYVLVPLDDALEDAGEALDLDHMVDVTDLVELFATDDPIGGGDFVQAWGDRLDDARRRGFPLTHG